MPKFSWRITKYDPARRENGRFLDETWTSVWDTAKDVAGATLTPFAYLATEDAYVRTAIALAVGSSAFELIEKEVEGTLDEIIEGQAELEQRGVPPIDPLPVIGEGQRLASHESGPAIRAVLRELAWMKLEYGSFYLHFGRDYYMYCGSDHDCAAAIRVATASGLFVEQKASPYN